jgi:hypothetical protein
MTKTERGSAGIEIIEHVHRRARKNDFEGKTVRRFSPTADNIWRFWFTDGTAFAIQSENFSGIACMELCDECVRERKPTPALLSAQAAGGRARAEKLSPERRKEIAIKASNARWNRT